MKQPYIYTMPEAFMLDESVPIKWRLYGYINGFWIAGKPVYATNSHFAERFKCSERHVSRALEELEKEGLLARDIEGFKRYILPGGMTPQVRGGRRGASVQGDVVGHHISDSISDNILGVATLRIESDSEKKPPKEKKDTTYLRVFELWGKYPLNWRKNRTEIEAAKNLLAEREVEDIKEALDFYKKNSQASWIPVISVPSDLDRKWDKLVAYSLKNK